MEFTRPSIMIDVDWNNSVQNKMRDMILRCCLHIPHRRRHVWQVISRRIHGNKIRMFTKYPNSTVENVCDWSRKTILSQQGHRSSYILQLPAYSRGLVMDSGIFLYFFLFPIYSVRLKKFGSWSQQISNCFLSLLKYGFRRVLILCRPVWSLPNWEGPRCNVVEFLRSF